MRHLAINTFWDTILGMKSIERLRLINISLNKAVNWSEMFEKHMNLSEFHLESTPFPSNEFTLISDRKLNENPNIISFSLIDCNITSIQTNLMNTWFELKMISLSNNMINELKRSWFHSTLPSLWSLDLSYNMIETIPQDFFNGMTAIRKLRLDNNRLKTLHKSWFQPIWPLLREFSIDRKYTPDYLPLET